MRYFKTVLFLAAILAILATLFIRAEGSYATAPASCGAWSIVKSPNSSFGVESLFNGVAAVSSNDVWAVGMSRNQSGFSSHTLTEHWNGSQWSIISSANPSSPFNNLRSVTAVSATNVWAVGQYDTSSGFHTLIEHWNGSQWKVVASPNPPSREGNLSGVDALTANNIWAVGFTTDMNGFSQTLAEHWNGTTRQLVASPNPDPMIDGLSSLSAASANNIWAVGIQKVASETLIEHWNGTQWQVVASPNRDGVSNILQSDSVVPFTSKVWAVGYSGNSTLTEFYC